ncbi:MAG: hypothetical protein WAL72_19795 [Streptosporangiaceae bacterium]
MSSAAYSDLPIFGTITAKRMALTFAATFTIVEAGAGEINDSRHKLPSASVVRAHKQIRRSERRMTRQHKMGEPGFVDAHSRRGR